MNVSNAQTFESVDITFDKNIKTIFQNNCTECHPGIINYATAFTQKDKILKKITSPINKQMPPPYVSPRLSKSEVELIREWIRTGAQK